MISLVKWDEHSNKLIIDMHSSPTLSPSPCPPFPTMNFGPKLNIQRNMLGLPLGRTNVKRLLQLEAAPKFASL